MTRSPALPQRRRAARAVPVAALLVPLAGLPASAPTRAAASAPARAAASAPARAAAGAGAPAAAAPAQAPAPAAEAPPPGGAATASPLVVEVRADEAAGPVAPPFTPGRVRAALAEALRLPVIAPGLPAAAAARGTLTVTFRPSRRELAVTYDAAGRGTVSRVVAAPADPEAAVAAAVQLAQNLVQDEADELLPARPVAPPPPSPPSPPPAAPPPAAPAAPAAEPPRPRPYALATLSLLFPIATNFDRPDVRTRLSGNLLYGRVGALEGLQLGVANQVDGPVSGGQLALGFNVADGPVSGFQLASAFNVAGGPVRGFQLAFGVNRSADDVGGLQAALGINSAKGRVSGAQLALGLNVAGDVQGLQLGLVNVADRVKGVQLGLVNVADDVEGIPIGLISVTESGGVHPVLWSSRTAYANLALKFATRYTYTMFGVAAHRDDVPDTSTGLPSATRDEVANLVGPQFAIGARVPFLPFYFETDLGSTYLFAGEICCPDERTGFGDDRLLHRLRALVGFELHRRFSLFVGTGLTVDTRFFQGDEDVTLRALPELFGGIQL